MERIVKNAFWPNVSCCKEKGYDGCYQCEVISSFKLDKKCVGGI